MGHTLAEIDAARRAPTTGAGLGFWPVAALIFFLALAPRLAPLNRYVTPDEPAWVYRSFRFGQALSAGEFADVPTTGHPGATTMWLGSAGIQIHRWLQPVEAAQHLQWLDGLAGLSPQSPAAYHHLAFFLPGGRIMVAIVASLGLAGISILTSRLWGHRAAVLATLLLALDPFLTGHSGLLHLDGLLATAMTLSALAMLQAVCAPHPVGAGRPRPGSPRPHGLTWTLLSGLFAGLAVLTKTPGVFMLPFAGLTFAAAWLSRRVSLRQALLSLFLWGLAASLTLVLLYPAFWHDPVATLQGMLRVGERHIEGALRPVFFQGQLTFEPDATFYPTVWLFRASPLVLIGLPVAIVGYLRRPGPRRFAVLLLLTMALAFGLFVTLVGKKHDRYLLPAFPPLTLVAALGWQRLSKVVHSEARAWNPSRLPSPGAVFPTLLFSLLILIQALLALPYLSLPLAYFNPLVGGPKAALARLEVGWGEGEGAAAHWLNQQPNARELTVAAASVPPFASLFLGESMPLNEQTLHHADYIVLSTDQASSLVPAGASGDPVYEYRVGPIRYASVVLSQFPVEQAEFLRNHAGPNDGIVLDADAALARRYDGPADLRVMADTGDPGQLAQKLGELASDHDRLWYVALPAASPITARQIQTQLECYGEPILVTSIGDTRVTRLQPDNLEPCVGIPGPGSGDRDGVRFDDLALLDYALLPNPVTGPDQLRLTVRWQAREQLGADYRAVLRLKDEAGHHWVDGGREILDTDYRRPSAWAPGDWTDQTFQLRVPPALPPGNYRVEVAVFDPDSGRGLSVWDDADRFAGLSFDTAPTVVAPPSAPPAPASVAIPERLEPPVTAGPLTLLGQDPPPSQVASGDRATFDLFWQANAPPGADYALRLQLVAPNGEALLTRVVGLSPYPTGQWRAQELVQARYDLNPPPELPAGVYTLRVNVLDPGGASIWTTDLALATVEVLARERLFELPSDIQYPLDLQLGTQVHFRGFDIDTLSASPGDEIPVTLYWQADGPTELSYTVFVHLVGPDGQLYGQVDRLPAHGAAPTHTWAPGQVIVDTFALPVLPHAPPGTYHVAVGLYDPISADRLPVSAASGTELPDGQVVLPVEITVQ